MYFLTLYIVSFTSGIEIAIIKTKYLIGGIMTHKTKTVLLVLLVLIMAVPAFALGSIAGASPIDNTLEVLVRIPTRVGINLSGTNIEFDLGDVAVTYPPAAFPGYYLPTAPAATPYVPLSVFCNVAAGWTLTVIADVDFDASLPVTQLYYANDGEAKSVDGGAVGGTWAAFSTAVSGAVANAAARTTGWDNYDQDYQLQITGNEAAMDPSTTVTITYTITSL